MRFGYRLLIVLVLATLFSATIADARPASMTSRETALAAQLRPLDQALLDAFTTGDRVAWARVVGPGFVYVAENEEAINAPRLLALLVPPKPNDEGADVKPFRIVDYTLRLAGDTATIIYHDAEQGTHLGSRLTGIDVTTEVWQRLDGRWALRLVHTTPVPTTPLAVSLSNADVASLVGQYRAANEQVAIRAGAGGITWQSAGRLPKQLRAEARDVLFEPGNPRIRYIFQRDMKGDVTGVLRRNENRAVAYTRTN